MLNQGVVMKSIENATAALVELVINTNLPIDEVEQRWVETFAGEIDSEVLGEIWVDVMSTLPELN
jgi:hypothetical protein